MEGAFRRLGIKTHYAWISHKWYQPEKGIGPLIYREFLREFSNAFNTDEAVLPNDTELVFFHTLNNYALKGIFESIDLIESDKTYMFYAEIDIRLKANIINIYDDNLVSPVIRYIQDLFIQIENDTYIEKYLSFE